ncbi:MbcA/ParS/Xre antitoxin family protein [Gallaecimonas kandeliae]|uniref:MbcA/ParS/Xre antitoxin family protein n=1 Tax=Gallaecimonas kandeliae TaxID=3029055 RepID=UPI002647F82F|nr:MbcA/ParS/Xre antitoxin family protein [Gallaecimonas kandeliae]WKE64093.1 MbcA/ParS/Xre antitoxin family protein [Gallaecimonas kandeliae]
MQALAQLDPKAVLSKALLAAGKELGLTQAEVGQVVGRNRTRLRDGLEPASKEGELALLLIRLHRSLFALTGGEPADIRHFMNTHNHLSQGVPKDQAQTVQGLVRLVNLLDGLRGKI